MEEIIKKFFNQMENILENFESIIIDLNIDGLDYYSDYDDFFKHKEEISSVLYKKYFSFIDNYIDDPKFIENLQLDKDKLENLPDIQLIFPEEKFNKIYSFYQKKIDELEDYIIIYDIKTIKMLLDQGITIEEILEKPNLEKSEENISYLLNLKRKEDGNLDPQFLLYLIDKHIDLCDDLVAENIFKGDYSLLSKYLNKENNNYFEENGKTKNLKELLTNISNSEEKIPSQETFFNKLFIAFSTDNWSCIDDIEIANKLIDKLGTKAIIFINNPSKELVDKANDFSIETYINYSGDYRKSSELLLLLLKKGHKEALQKANYEAFNDERIISYIKEHNISDEYIKNNNWNNDIYESLLYTKYLVNNGNYGCLYYLGNVYEDIDKFNYIYEIAEKTEIECPKDEYGIIYALAGKEYKKLSFNGNNISKEVANRLIELGFTLEMYLESNTINHTLLESFIEHGEKRALLVYNNLNSNLIDEHSDEITYELFKSMKDISGFKLGINQAVKLMKDGHLDVFDYVDSYIQEFVISKMGYNKLTPEEYEQLPENIKNSPDLKKLFIIPETLDEIRKLVADSHNSFKKHIKKAYELGMPYEEIIKYLDDDISTEEIPFDIIKKYVEEEKYEILKYFNCYNAKKEEIKQIVDILYSRKDKLNYEELQLEYNIDKEIFKRYIEDKDYSFIKNSNGSSIVEKELVQSDYNYNNFLEYPMFTPNVIIKIITEDNIDEIINYINTKKEYHKIFDAEDLIISMIKRGFSKENIKKISKYCTFDFNKILDSLNEDEYDIISYLDNSEILQPSTLSIVIDKLSIDQLYEITKNSFIDSNTIDIIIKKKMKDGHPEIVKLYQNNGNIELLKQAILMGYYPSIEEKNNSYFIKNNINKIGFNKTEKEVLKEKLADNPKLIVFFQEEIRENPNILKEYIIKDPEIFYSLNDELKNNREILLLAAELVPVAVASVFNSLSDENKIASVVKNPEITKSIDDNIYLNEEVLLVITRLHPEIINNEKRQNVLNDEMIEVALKSNYKITENTPKKVLVYALNNNINVPTEIWNKDNIDKIYEIANINYEEHQSFYNEIFDKVYKESPDEFICDIYLKMNYTKEIVLKRYNHSLNDFIGVDFDRESVLNRINLNKIKTLPKEQQLQIISEKIYSSPNKKEYIKWLEINDFKKEASMYSKKFIKENPLEYVKYILDEDKDEELISTVKGLIIENLKEYYSLYYSYPEVLEDKEVVLKMITIKNYIYKDLKDELKKDPTIIGKFIDSSENNIGNLINEIPKDIDNYLETCYKALAKDGNCYSYLDEFKSDEKALRIALTTCPRAIFYADESLYTKENFSLITDINALNLSNCDINIVLKLIEYDLVDINNKTIINNIIYNISNNINNIQITDYLNKFIERTMKSIDSKEFLTIYKLIDMCDENQLSDEIKKVKSLGSEVLNAYGKVNTLDKNPVFSYDLLVYAYPTIGIENTIDLMKYNSGADKEIEALCKSEDKELVNKFIDFVKKHEIFEQDSKCIHYAFRKFSNSKELIKSIIDSELTEEEIVSLRKVLTNNNRYNIFSYDELKRYDEIVTEYAEKILESDNIYEVKKYLANILGFEEYQNGTQHEGEELSLENTLLSYQLDNFENIRMILLEIEEKYGKDRKEELKFSEEELKTILLMKKVLESNDIEELKKIIQVHTTEDNKVFDYSDTVDNIIIKVRKLYNYQFNANLSNPKELKSKRRTFEKEITDYKGETKKSSVEIIEMDDEPFKFLAHRIYNYDSNMDGIKEMIMKDPSLWTKLDGASTLSTSSISDKGLWMINPDDNSGIIYLFSDLPDDFMLFMYGRDLYVSHGGHHLEPTANNNRYTDIDGLNQASTNHHGEYNEVAGFREGMIPSAIACVGDNPTEEQIRAADYFNIPIIKINQKAYDDKKEKKFTESKTRLKEKSSIEDIYNTMFNGIRTEKIEENINYCIQEIRNNYLERKITYKEMIQQLTALRNYANRIIENPKESKDIKKINLLIETIALEKKLTDEELIDIEYANMGESGIMYKQVEDGKEYLVKPAVDKQKFELQSFRAEIQKSSSRLQKIISPDTAVEVDVIGTGNLRLSKQEKLSLSENPELLNIWAKSGGNLDKKYTDQLLKEYVVDFLLCNFDCFAGNFIIDENNNIRGVDKEQSFRFMNNEASLDPSFSYTPNGSSRIPIYQLLFNRYNNNEIDLDFTSFDEAIKIVEEITDEEYREIFRGYAESIVPEFKDQLLDRIVERKHECTKRMKEYINTIRKDKEKIEGDVR